MKRASADTREKGEKLENVVPRYCTSIEIEKQKNATTLNIAAMHLLPQTSYDKKYKLQTIQRKM